MSEQPDSSLTDGPPIERGPLILIDVDSRGNELYVQTNEVGGHTYWSTEIGNGVVVWDTSLASEEMLWLALKHEAERRQAFLRPDNSK